MVKLRKKIIIVTSRKKLLDARFNDLIMTLYHDDKIKVKDYHKCLEYIHKIKKAIKLDS